MDFPPNSWKSPGWSLYTSLDLNWKGQITGLFLLSLFWVKLYERLIQRKLLKFFNKYEVLYDDQYGFLRGRSTTDAILKFTDCCYNSLNSRNYVAAIYLDFTRAFDTIDHDVLCRKLEACGVRGTMNEWFRSYLGGRSQFVDVQGNTSSVTPITGSVPQGSILGPLCFLIYVNDMNRSKW